MTVFGLIGLGFALVAMAGPLIAGIYLAAVIGRGQNTR